MKTTKSIANALCFGIAAFGLTIPAANAATITLNVDVKGAG